MMDLGIVQFATPWALVFLAAFPAWWLWRRRRPTPAIIFSRVGVLASGPRAGRFMPRVLFGLRNAVLIGSVLALARPRSGARAEDVTSEGINIVIAFDIS